MAHRASVKESLQRAFEKVISSRLITFYLGFSLFYCVVQTGLSARAFLDNSRPDDTLSAIATAGNARNFSIPVFNGTQLALCASTSEEVNYQCSVVWDGVSKNNNASQSIMARGGQFNAASAPVSIALDGSNLELDQSCLFSLNFPIYELDHAKRENVAFLCFQIWVFIMSSIAVFNESIPHIFASLLTHVMVITWGVFEAIQTVGFQVNYKRVITEGACRGADLLPDLFAIRRMTEIPMLIINFVALLVSGVLTLRLVRLLNWRNFKNVGANLQMNRHRKIMLALFISIQLSLFFVVIFAGLVLDLLIKGNLSVSASFPVLYKTSAILSIVMAGPWMASGWYAVQYELRLAMFFFLSWALVWLAGFGAMFFSTSFSQEFMHWPFLATVGVIAVILTAISFILGVACRFNFGKGYLQAKDIQAHTPVVGEQKEKSWDVENSPHTEDKIVFPSSSQSDIPQLTYEPAMLPMPTPPPRSMFKPRLGPGVAGNKMGPRFFARGAPTPLTMSSSSESSSSGVPPPLYDVYPDSASSFGNVAGLSSAGHGRRSSNSHLSAAPRGVSEAISTGKLGRMFSSSSSGGRSMYTDSHSVGGGLGYQDSWSSFGPHGQQQQQQQQYTPQRARSS